MLVLLSSSSPWSAAGTCGCLEGHIGGGVRPGVGVVHGTGFPPMSDVELSTPCAPRMFLDECPLSFCERGEACSGRLFGFGGGGRRSSHRRVGQSQEKVLLFAAAHRAGSRRSVDHLLYALFIKAQAVIAVSDLVSPGGKVGSLDGFMSETASQVRVEV